MFLRVLPFYDLRYREDFSKGASLESLVSSLLSTGFQATNVGLAIHEINRMVSGKSYHFKPSLQAITSSSLVLYTSSTNHYTLSSQLEWRLIDRPIAENENELLKDLEIRRKTKCTIFFSYTSNMISSGIRETIRFLVQNKLVSSI